MGYEFLKENIKQAVKNDFDGLSLVHLFKYSAENTALIEHNAFALNSLMNFLSGKDDYFCLNGFGLSGKSLLIDLAMQALNEKTIVLAYNCFESTSLDDILMSFYENFKNAHKNTKIPMTKLNSNSFGDKLNLLIKNVENPILIIIDSFENITSENQKTILDFISHLGGSEKIKVIFGSKSFDVDLLSSVKFESVILKPFTEKECEKLANIDSATFSEFYKFCHGHYIYLDLFKKLNQDMTKVLEEFEVSKLTFLDFLITKILKNLDTKFHKLFNLLTISNYGLSFGVISKFNFAIKADLEKLVQDGLLEVYDEIYYLKKHFKISFATSMSDDAKLKSHKFLKELYENQLPKKPTERDILISRASARAQILYHTSKIELINPDAMSAKKSTKAPDFSYLSYSKGSNLEWLNAAITKTGEKPASKTNTEESIPKNLPDEMFKFSQEEIMLLNEDEKEKLPDNIADLPLQETSSDEQNTKPFEEEELTAQHYFQLSQKAEDNFDYEDAISYCQKALECQNDPELSNLRAQIITKQALCAKKAGKFNIAIEYFQKVYDLYLNQNQPIKANYILFNMAQIHKQTYKLQLAQTFYEQIVNSSQDNPKNLIASALLDWAGICDSLSKHSQSLELTRKALEYALLSDDLAVISLSQFKYAILLDDAGFIDSALEHYIECAKISDIKLNENLSSAYANMASIYSEQDNEDEAIKNYKLAIKLDKSQNNFDGLYFAYTKLAEIYKFSNPDNAYKYSLRALSAAKRLGDKLYISNIYVDIGDIYYNKKQDKMALKAYFLARNLVKKNLPEKSLNSIDIRINDIKVRIGGVEFLNIVKDLDDNAN